MKQILTWLVPATLAWGVLAFGAVYPWAYWPLLIAATGIGLWGIAGAGLRARATLAAWPAAGLAAVGLTLSLQLVPLPRDTLAAISPTTDAFLRQHNVPYSTATSVTNDMTALWRSHPVSLYPASTRRAVGFVVALGVFLIGLTARLSANGTASPNRLRQGYGGPPAFALSGFGWVAGASRRRPKLRAKAEGLAYDGRVRRLAEAITALGVVVALIGIIQKATVTTGKLCGGSRSSTEAPEAWRRRPEPCAALVTRDRP